MADNGERDIARKYYLETIEIGKNSLGLSHPETVKTIDGLGTIYLDEEEFEQALPYFLLAYKLFKVTLDQKHNDVVRVYKQ